MDPSGCPGETPSPPECGAELRNGRIAAAWSIAGACGVVVLTLIACGGMAALAWSLWRYTRAVGTAQAETWAPHPLRLAVGMASPEDVLLCVLSLCVWRGRPWAWPALATVATWAAAHQLPQLALACGIAQERGDARSSQRLAIVAAYTALLLPAAALVVAQTVRRERLARAQPYARVPSLAWAGLALLLVTAVAGTATGLWWYRVWSHATEATPAFGRGVAWSAAVCFVTTFDLVVTALLTWYASRRSRWAWAGAAGVAALLALTSLANALLWWYPHPGLGSDEALGWARARISAEAFCYAVAAVLVASWVVRACRPAREEAPGDAE